MRRSALTSYSVCAQTADCSHLPKWSDFEIAELWEHLYALSSHFEESSCSTIATSTFLVDVYECQVHTF